MTEHHDQASLEAGCRKFHTADLGWSDDVARDADDEQIAEPLVEDDLCRHTRIGTPEDDRERLLSRRQRLAAGAAHSGLLAAYLGDETTVAFAQPLQCFVCRDHRLLGGMSRIAAANRAWASASTGRWRTRVPAGSLPR